MEKTVKYLEEKGIFTRLRTSTALTEMLFEALTKNKVSEDAKREAYRDLIMKELTKDKDLLDAVLDDVTDEIIKHI